MRPFLDDNFLLKGETAIDLYHSFAKDMPIIDYHCHLSPKEIYENKTFRNLTDVWLSGDHYKWRALRSNGVEERLITGDADDWDKFTAWASTVPVTLGNPLYHWSHLELKRYFGIDELINGENAKVIWEKANAKLTSGEFGARDLITRSNVKVICTTDDPADTLEFHIKLKEDSSFDIAVLPSFRPDKALEITGPPSCLGSRSWDRLQVCRLPITISYCLRLIRVLRSFIRLAVKCLTMRWIMCPMHLRPMKKRPGFSPRH